MKACTQVPLFAATVGHYFSAIPELQINLFDDDDAYRLRVSNPATK
jgi:hypothetical protein